MAWTIQIAGKHCTVSEPRIHAGIFLSDLPIFSSLGEAALARVTTGTTEIDAPRNTLLFRRGDYSSSFLIVVCGQVKLSLESMDGNEKVVELAGPGSHFGEAAMFLGKPHLVTAETIADSKLLQIPRDTVLEAMNLDPGFSECMIKSLSLRLYQRVADLESYTLLSGTERIIDYLLQSCPRKHNGTLSVTLPAKKGIIASQLNLTHEHFSRILHDLMAANLIEVEGREVRILDEQRLRDYGS
jgi:CRP-like cAMP-binding protein